MGRRRHRAPAIALALVLTPGVASGQLHGDVSAQVGGMKRFLGDRPAGGGDDAGFGPVGQLTGHVALLPLVHVGGYFGHDLSPLPGDGSARNITFGGLRAKLRAPLPSTSFRAWAFVGFGYAGVYQPSYDTSIASGGGVERQRVRVEGAGGSFFELPFGIGASYKVRKPWELCAELGARVGFGHVGSAYRDPGPQVTVLGGTGTGQNAAPAGIDRFGLALTVGVMLDL